MTEVIPIRPKRTKRDVLAALLYSAYVAGQESTQTSATETTRTADEINAQWQDLKKECPKCAAAWLVNADQILNDIESFA